MLAIGDHVVPPFVDDSHRITFPVCPERASVPPFEPEHTVASDATDPPTETAFTVIVAAEEFAFGQTPLCTTALYEVVCVRLE